MVPTTSRNLFRQTWEKEQSGVVEISHQKAYIPWKFTRKGLIDKNKKRTHIILLSLFDNPKRMKQDENKQQFGFINYR